jgi:hypothetical protein
MSGSRRKNPSPPAVSPGAFPNIELLIDGDGDITIGRVGPIRCAATAADEDQCLAMLVRRPGESLAELLQRLDAAIEDAYENGVHIDEVNTPPRSKPAGRSRA